MITNSIPISQLSIGDMVVVEGKNIHTTPKSHKLLSIVDRKNGTKLLHLSGNRTVNVMSKGEIKICVQ